jgi:hypothetical protein
MKYPIESLSGRFWMAISGDATLFSTASDA